MTQDSSAITLSQLLQRFDETHPEQEAGTRYIRHLAFEQLIAVCGDRPLGEFGLDDAVAYRAALLGGFHPQTIDQVSRLNQMPPRARQGLERGFKPVTAASYLKMVRSPFRTVAIAERADYDQWQYLPRIKVPRKPVGVYSDQKLGALLAAARQVQDERLTEGRVLVMATAGLRRSEAFHLLAADVDWDADQIIVQSHAETEATVAWDPKDDDWRRVPLVQQARAVLEYRRTILPPAQPYLLLSADRYAYLMYLRSRGRLTDRIRDCLDENWRPFRRIREEAGTTGLSQKHLRCTFATNSLRDGVDIRSVQGMMGHSSLETTEKYLAPEASAIEKARVSGTARLSRLGA
jgi:integrase/recombinase XerC